MDTSITVANEDQIYTGYDQVIGPQFCTKTYLGCKLCVSVSMVNAQVILTLSLHTPVGNVQKSFKIPGNIHFTWQPSHRFKVGIVVSDFRKEGNHIHFIVSGSLCVYLKRWWCLKFTHHFDIQGGGLQLSDAENLDDYQLASLLALSTAVEEDTCNCG